jgi:hypothetical protein
MWDTRMTEQVLDQVLHLTEVEAMVKIEKAGLKPRITSKEGKHFICTRDYHTDRINLDIENGVVVRATIG